MFFGREKSMIADRLVLGTANFVNEYNGMICKNVPGILSYAQKIGINAIDIATAYKTENLGDSNFRRTLKIANSEEAYKLRTEVAHIGNCLMAHCPKAIYPREWIRGLNLKTGVSVYSPQDLNNEIQSWADVIQTPYSIYDRRFEDIFRVLKASGKIIQVRSVFLRGRVLKVLEPWKAVAFCLMNPNIDHVIIGTDSLEQLKEAVEPLLKLESYKTDDLNFIDPRKWGK